MCIIGGRVSSPLLSSVTPTPVRCPSRSVGANVEAFEDEEDEEGFKFLATLLVKTASTMNRKVNTWSMETRIFFTRLFCPSKRTSLTLIAISAVLVECLLCSGGYFGGGAFHGERRSGSRKRWCTYVARPGLSDGIAHETIDLHDDA